MTRSRYDQVFGPDTPQEAIFEDTKQLVQSVMDGFNVCVFAYGQTGSGKTYTMEGDLDDWRQNAGINLRALEELFRLRDEKIDEASFRIQMSMLEIYCDSVRDLLVPPSRAGASLEVKSMGDTAAYCPGLTLLPVETTQDVVESMLRARENRATSATNMNSSSSRSHSVRILAARHYLCSARLALAPSSASRFMPPDVMDGCGWAWMDGWMDGLRRC
jgi:kinesin family protein C2/C3